MNESRISSDIDDLTPEYFREVLLSYRLIFGQNKASYRAFNRKIPTWGARWNCSCEDAKPDQQYDDSDPMLLTLCGSTYKSPNARRIYEAIDALDDVTEYYHPYYDFPFLGNRLLNLQSFVKSRNPHSWTALWHDRRNIAFWWTFWVSIIINTLVQFTLADALIGGYLHWRPHYFARYPTGISSFGEHNSIQLEAP